MSVTFCSSSKSFFPHFIDPSTLTVCTCDIIMKRWIACQLYFIILAVRIRDVQNHDRLECLLNRILSFSQSVHVTYKTMTNLNGFSIVFYHSCSPYTRCIKPWQTWMASQSYFIVLTVRIHNVQNHDRLPPVWGSLRLAQTRHGGSVFSHKKGDCCLNNYESIVAKNVYT